MAMAIPLGTALAGGALFGQYGMAVGWLVGAWAYNAFFAPKNDVMDTGAEEMPRFNQSLRGTTIPILFGTNKVSSQIVLAKNFNKDKVDDSGGKMGGSGGITGSGKGGATKGTYIYYWDLIFHLGMVHQEMYVFRGWNAAQRIRPNHLLALNPSAANTLYFASLNIKGGKKKDFALKYDSKHFFRGSETDNNPWNVLENLQDTPIVWPYTVWVGFEQLELGAAPTIPQFSFEIGPGGGTPQFTGSTIVYDQTYNYADHVTIGGLNSMFTHPTGVDKYGWVYLANDTLGGADGVLKVNLNDNSTYLITPTMTQALLDAVCTPHPANNPFAIEAAVFVPLLRGEYIGVAFSFSRTNAGGLDARQGQGLLLCTPNADGSLTAVNYVASDLNVFTGTSFTFHQMFLFEPPTINTPIFGIGRDYVDITSFIAWPSIQQIIDESVLEAYPFSATYVIDNYVAPRRQQIDLDDGASNEEWPSWITYNTDYENKVGRTHELFWSAPFLENDGEYSTKVYHFANKAMMTKLNDDTVSTPRDFIVDQFRATRTGGCVARAYLFNGYKTWASLIAGSWSSLSASAWEDVTGDFLDADGAAAIPFPNDGVLTRNDSADNTIGFYSVAMDDSIDFQRVVYFLQYDDETYAQSGNYGRVAIRSYIYNTADDTWTELYSAALNMFTIGQITYSPGTTTLGTPNIKAFRYNNQIYIVSGIGYSGSNVAKRWRVSKLGGFNFNNPVDLTPPEIIKEILANPIFGVGFDYTDIDDTSWQTAHDYCVSNNFYVSTQYRREEGYLQVIELLLSVYGGFISWTSDSGKIKFGINQYTSSPVRTIDNDHLVVDTRGKPPVSVSKKAAQDTYNRVRVNYFDRSTEYKQNQVEENDEVDEDLNGVKMKEFPAQFVMSEETARSMALRSLVTNLYVREQYEFMLGWKDADLEPGDVITLVDSFSSINTQCRITRWQEKKRGVFEVTAVQEDQIALETYVTSSYTFIDSYDTGGTFASAAVAAYFTMYELPPELSLTGNKYLYVGWNPEGDMAGGALYTGVDNTTFTPVQVADGYPLGGKLEAPLANNPNIVRNFPVNLLPRSVDVASGFDYWAPATLPEVSPLARANGMGLIWVGSELIAYETVTLVAQNRYTLGRVYRGWAGTPISDHSSGAYWHRHGSSVIAVEFGEDQVGKTLYYKLVPYDDSGQFADISSITAKTYTILGLGYTPAPVTEPTHVWSGEEYRGRKTVQVNTPGDIRWDWRQTAWKSGFGFGPYGGSGGGINTYGNFTADNSVSYLVNIIGSGDTVVHSTVVGTTSFTYPQSTNVTNNGAWRGNVALSVKARNQYGLSYYAKVASLNLYT